MKSIILAGGRSKRLLPITNRKPKCLLKIGGETLIDRLLHILKDNEITEIVMVTGFRAQRLSRYVSESHPDINFTFVENKYYATTLPAYGFYLAREHLEGAVLYLNSDIYCDSRMIEEVIQHPEPSVTAIQENTWDEEEVNVVLGKDMEIKEIGKNIAEEDSQGEFMGITKLSPEFNNYLKDALNEFERKLDRKKFAVDAINLAIEQGAKLVAHDVSQYSAREIDTIDDFNKAKKLAL